MRVGERGSLNGNRRNLLAHCEHIRDANGEVGKECVQCGASLVAGARRITSFLLEMLQEAEYRVEREVFERQLCNRSMPVGSKKTQQEA